MAINEHIYVLTGDLGYKMWDGIRDRFPDKFINCGASEQAMLDIAVGIALAREIPFVYSITPFLFYRGYETIRNYINHEKIPVRLVGSGRGKDYTHDGFSHDATEVDYILRLNPAIKIYTPQTDEIVSTMLHDMIYNDQPCFISLKR